MDNVYAFGVDIIVLLQQTFSQQASFFEYVNSFTDPSNVIAFLYPFVAVFDSVFAAELILVTSFINWVNIMLKWVLMEHRPYWWVRETRYYGPYLDNKPHLLILPQTCETGPGCPSGHVMSTAGVMMLASAWLFTMLKEKCPDTLSKIQTWLQRSIVSFQAIFLILVTASRIFVSTHFPHQCVLGALFGYLCTYILCRKLSIPLMDMKRYFIQHFGPSPNATDLEGFSYPQLLRWRMFQNVMLGAAMIATSFAIYWGQKLFNFDPLWSVKLAFKWCTTTDYLHYSTTPLFTVVESTGLYIGWALAATPSIENYRFSTKTRSLVLAMLSAAIFHLVFQYWQSMIATDNATYFYIVNFIMYIAKPIVLLRVVPMLANLPNRCKRPTPPHEEINSKATPEAAVPDESVEKPKSE